MRFASQEDRSGSRDRRFGRPRGAQPAFTLVELLVVFGMIAVLTALLVPALAKVRRQARMVVGIGNQRQITAAADCFAADNADAYPPSVATIGTSDAWNWQEPTMLTGYLKRTPTHRRSMSAYLHSYVPDARTMFCPNAPLRYEYLEQAWDAGDKWDHPNTAADPDAMIGTYCFYWNYVGYLGENAGLFRGPRGPVRGRRESRTLVTDYFGYGHWRSLNAYGSCERMADADITEGTCISSAYWSTPRGPTGTAPDWDRLRVRLHAGYVDGHVESYYPSETAAMAVILDRESNEPYSFGMGPGVFYLPRVGIR